MFTKRTRSIIRRASRQPRANEELVRRSRKDDVAFDSLCKFISSGADVYRREPSRQFASRVAIGRLALEPLAIQRADEIDGVAL
jgi:hypothetical protein